MCVMAVCIARARLVLLCAPARARGAMTVPHAYPVLGAV